MKKILIIFLILITQNVFAQVVVPWNYNYKATAVMGYMTKGARGQDTVIAVTPDHPIPMTLTNLEDFSFLVNRDSNIFVTQYKFDEITNSLVPISQYELDTALAREYSNILYQPAGVYLVPNDLNNYITKSELTDSLQQFKSPWELIHEGVTNIVNDRLHWIAVNEKYKVGLKIKIILDDGQECITKITSVTDSWFDGSWIQNVYLEYNFNTMYWGNGKVYAFTGDEEEEINLDDYLVGIRDSLQLLRDITQDLQQELTLLTSLVESYHPNWTLWFSTNGWYENYGSGVLILDGVYHGLSMNAFTKFLIRLEFDGWETIIKTTSAMVDENSNRTTVFFTGGLPISIPYSTIKIYVLQSFLDSL